MFIDLYEKASELLIKIANSIHEREHANIHSTCFSKEEVEIVKEFLFKFSEELKQ